MAHTRGVSRKFVPDDGVILGKGGVPLDPTGNAVSGGAPAYDGSVQLDRDGNPVAPVAAGMKKQPVRMDGHAVVRGPGAERIPDPGVITGYRADSATWARGMDAWTLAKLLDLALRKPADLADGFVVNLTPEEFATLPGDLRMQFVAVRSV